jgi:hypothetical protein
MAMAEDAAVQAAVGQGGLHPWTSESVRGNQFH